MCGNIENYPKDDDAKSYRIGMAIRHTDFVSPEVMWMIPNDDHVVICVSTVLWNLRYARPEVPHRLKSVLVSEDS